VKDHVIVGALSWQGAAASLAYKAAVEQGVRLSGSADGKSIEEIIAEAQAVLN
jgi:nitrite reductase (NADH) large subunit